ncbi:hypothetical protein RCO48_11400 [Peribacillus frigoritolerans]|nr:hypothetical protein [Peribacillus frigoritolerans]
MERKVRDSCGKSASRGDPQAKVKCTPIVGHIFNNRRCTSIG